MIKVAQCWDDGVATDIRLVEILRRYNAKATFNLCPGVFPETTQKPYWLHGKQTEWNFQGFHGGRVGKNDLKEVYSGFQVASHCMTHENAGVVSDQEFIKAASDARAYLEDLFQQKCTGFAWPCGRFTPETIALMKQAGFTYGRTVQNTDDVLSCREPLTLDSSCHYLSWQFWNKFEEARKRPNGVFYFWGHSYEMMDHEPLWIQLEEKIALLSQDPEVEWIDVCDIPELMKRANDTSAS